MMLESVKDYQYADDIEALAQAVRRLNMQLEEMAAINRELVLTNKLLTEALMSRKGGF